MSSYPSQSCYDPCRPRHFSSGSSLYGSKRRTRWSSGSCYGGSYGQGIRYFPPCGYGYGGYQGPAYGGICYQPLGYDSGYGYGYGYGNKYCPPVCYGGYGSGGYDYGCKYGKYGGLYGRRQSICYDPCYGPRYQYGSRRGSFCGPY